MWEGIYNPVYCDILGPQDQGSVVPSTVQAHSKKPAQSEEQALPL